MKRKTLLTMACGAFCLAASAAPNATAMADSGVHGYVPADYVEVTDPAVKANLEHFRDLKLGLMMHFGIYSQVGIDESWPLVDSSAWRARQMTDMGVGDTFKSNYWNLAKTFNPIRFDADAWARAAATNGFKYLCFTTKHHDGFAMFDTKYSDFKITGRDCPYASRPNADMVRDIWDAFRRRGLAISCYFSKADWHHEDFWENHGIGYETTWYPTYLPKEKPEKWTRFEQFMRNQMVELCRDYGRIEIMWLDGASVGCRPDTRVDMDGILAECRKYQPWLIAADRSIKGPNQQLMTPEQTVPAEPMACPWESCITMASNWSYRFDDEYKSAKELVQLFVGIVAKGGCLALNVAPRPDGVIPQPALERMNAMGAWLRKNGEAIYATRPLAPYSSRNWCFTQRDDKRYAIRLTREGERDLRRIVLDGTKFGAARITRIVHVPTQREMAFVRVTDGWAFDLPDDIEADPYAEVFRFEVSDEAPDVPANVTIVPDPVVADRLIVSWTTRLKGSSIVRYGAVANDLNVTVHGAAGTDHRVTIPTAGFEKIYISVETDGRRSPVQEVGCGPHPTRACK